jgi:hypothetical protein
MENTYNSFIFTHIPKCGGTSFRKYIFEAAMRGGLKTEQLFIPGFGGVGNEKNLPQLNKNELYELRKSNLKIIANHAQFHAIFDYKIRMDQPFYYTIFREPISRILSHYNFFYFHLGYDDLKGVHLDKVEKDKLSKLMKNLANVQCNYLVGYDEHDLNRGMTPQERLQLAKFNLKHEFACFGILERMEESLELLKDNPISWLPFDDNFPVQNRNTMVKSYDISDEVKEMVTQYNQLDIDLYNYANNLFDSRQNG